MARGRERGWLSIGAAVAAHAIAFALVRSMALPVAAAPAPAVAEEPGIEIGIEDLVAAPPAPPTPAEEGHALVAAAANETHGPRAASRGEAAPAAAAEPGETTSTEPAASGAVPAFAAPRVAIDGPNPFLAAGAVAEAPPSAHEPTEREKTADAKRRVEAALRQPARDRERELGLGPEGPVLTALGDATSTTTTPVRGRAVFVAIANGAGEVVSIRVTECDGAQRDWAQAATIALGSLKGKKLRVPSTTTRAEMRIEVTSAWKLPSGQDPGADVSVLGVPVAKGEGKDSTKVEILNPLPKVEMLKLGKDIEIPVVVWNVTIFGTNGDPANIGAGARRVVHARLLDSKVM